jgi:hypothetical protein
VTVRTTSLIIVGATHRGQRGRVFPGSTAERLMSDADCPVAIAPNGYAARVGCRDESRIGKAMRDSVDLDLARRAACPLVAVPTEKGAPR